MKDFEYNGIWWLATNPEQVVGGTLSFSQDEGVLLRVMGPIGSGENQWGNYFNSEVVQYPLILGATNEGGEISLVNCSLSNHHYNSVGFTSQTFRVVFAYIGSHFETPENLRFALVSVQYSHLSDWAGVSGFSWSLPRESKKGPYTLTYSEPEDFIVNTINAEIRITQTLNVKLDMPTPSMRQTTVLSIERDSGSSLQDFLVDFISPFQNFLTLATTAPNSIDNVSVYIPYQEEEDEASTSRKKKVSVFFQPTYRNTLTPRLHPSDMLFTLDDIRKRPNTFANWVSISKTLEPVFHWYFSDCYNPSKYTERNFLSSLKAVELYHLINYPEDIIAYKNLPISLQSRLERSRLEFRDGIQEQLLYIQLPLAERLQRLISIAANVMEPIIKNNPSLIERIVATKEYLEYYRPDAKVGSLQGVQLYWAIQVLKVLLQYLLLQEIGFSAEECQQFFEKNKQYQNIILRVAM